MNERDPGMKRSVSEIFEGVSVPGMEGEASKEQGGRDKSVARKKPKKHLMEHVYARLLGGDGKEVPRKQKVMTFMIPVLLVVLVVMMMKVLDVTSPRSVNAGTETKFKKPDNLWKLDHWDKPDAMDGKMRDPMCPGQAGGGGYGNLILTGIVFSTDDPMAVVNGEILRPGDEIGEAKVLAIGKDFVVFESEDKRWKQRIQQ